MNNRIQQERPTGMTRRDKIIVALHVALGIALAWSLLIW